MPLPNREKYEQRKIDTLIQYLRLYAQKGQPIDYEILVDGFKAVRRTNDPDMFTMFENFVTAETRSIEVLLFTGSSNNNEKRIFYFGDGPKEKEEGLNGVDVKNLVDQEVSRKMLAKEFDDLKKENNNLKQHISDLESEVDELEKHNARLEARYSPLNNVFGEIGSSLLESFIKRNPKLMATIPGGEALAGVLQPGDSEGDAEPTAESEVSFKPKTSAPSTNLSHEDQAAIQFVNQLKAQFTRQEFDNILLVLQALSEDKSKIESVLNHVNVKQQV